MITVVIVELAVAVLFGGVFAVAFGVSAPWWKDPVSQQLMAMAIIITGADLSLLAAALGFRVPLWWFVVEFGAVDVVMARWLWLLWWPGKGLHSD